MLKYRKDGVSVMVVLDRRRKKNSGLFPVKIEVVYRRHQKYIPTGVDISETEWEKISVRNGNSSKLPDIERKYTFVRNAVDSIVQKGTFSLQKLQARISRSGSLTVNSSMRRMMERFLLEGKVNSYYRCRSTLLNIEKVAGDSIFFTDITPAWLERCERQWILEGKSPTTVNIYMKTLKALLYEALGCGIIQQQDFPFSKTRYTLPRPASRKLALSKQQIKKIIDYRGPEELEMYRDLWLFSYLCNGINFKDMLSLKYSSISDGEICFIRSKTTHAYGRSRVIKAVLCPEMQRIIRRWGNAPGRNGDTLIFPFLTGKEDSFRTAITVRQVIGKCNRALRKIALRLGIPPFTTYSARHSFATILQRSGIAISFISESLGHSSLSVTEHYLAGFDRETRLRNSRILTEFS